MSGFSISDSLDRIVNELWTNKSDAITEFPAMWYRIFIWAFFSSIFIHTVASLIAFATLRKHRIGRFFPVLVFLMGILGPLTTGVITSATIAFIYWASSSLAKQMFPMYAFLYGIAASKIVSDYVKRLKDPGNCERLYVTPRLKNPRSKLFEVMLRCMGLGYFIPYPYLDLREVV